MVILFNNVYQWKRLSCGKFDSFEYAALRLRSSSRAAIITIYRPPKYNAQFSDDFTSLMSAVCIEPDNLLIVDEFNFHIDCHNDANANELLNILDSFGLYQHATEPTHNNKGHTPDLIISKGLQTSEVGVGDVTLSDLYSVFFKTSLPVETCRTKTEVIGKRFVNENTCSAGLSHPCSSAFSFCQ